MEAKTERKPIFALTGSALEDALGKCEEDVPTHVEQLLSAGTTFMLSGDGDSGKSVITANAAAAMSSGTPVWGQFECTRPFQILYLLGERNAKETLIRLKRMRSQVPFNSENLTISDKLVGQIDFSNENWTNAFINDVAAAFKTPPLDFLFLEPIYTMVPAWDERHVLGLVRSLAKIKDRLGCSIWLSHHNTKTIINSSGQETRRSNAYYGPVWLFNHCEAQYSIEKTGEYSRSLTLQKDNHRILLRVIPLLYDPDRCSIVMDPKSDNAPLKVRDKVEMFLRAYRKNGLPFTLAEIYAQTGVSQTSLRRIFGGPPWKASVFNTSPAGQVASYRIKMTD